MGCGLTWPLCLGLKKPLAIDRRLYHLLVFIFVSRLKRMLVLFQGKVKWLISLARLRILLLFSLFPIHIDFIAVEAVEPRALLYTKRLSTRPGHFI